MERLKTWRLAWEGGPSVTARYRPSGPVGVLLAHGAGVGQDAPFLVSIRDGLADAGHSVMTFNYPYMDAGRRAPNQMASLLSCHRAAAGRLADLHSAVVLAGKSMGGRMASYLAADGIGAGLVVYGYPLVAVGKDRPRPTDHFREIDQPAFFVQGSRDRMAPLRLLRPRVKKIAGGRLHVVVEADHGFRVPKRTGRTQEEVMAELVEVTAAWISTAIR